ncbi:MAG: SPOR domain-containing protein [Candidatus Omnitrophota bacterium]
MINPDFQKDLFENRFYEKKVKKPSLLTKYSERRFLSYVRIAIEHMVIVAIGIFIAIIIAYAIGVEKGKSISAVNEVTGGAKSVFDHEKVEIIGNENVSEQNLEQQEKIQDSEEQILLLYESEEELIENVTKIKEQGEEDKTSFKEEDFFDYTVQLASFRKEDSSAIEINKLKEKGFDALSARKGEWYQVYVKGYSSLEDAKKAKDKLLEDYKDCYIRRSKQAV